MNTVLDQLLTLRKSGISLSLDDSGNNLKLKGDLKLLTEEQKEQIRQNKEAIVSFLKESVARVSEIPVCGITDRLPLAPNQKGIWLHEQLEDLGASYIIPAIYFYELQEFKIDLFHAALEIVVRNNDAFRMIFGAENGTPYLSVLESVSVNNHCSFQQLPDNEALQQSLIPLNNTPFPKSAPQWSIDIFEIPGSTFCFFLRLHHLIGDGESLPLFIQSVISTYLDLCNGVTPTHHSGIAYADYISWISDKQNVNSHQSFWKSELSDYPDDFHFPVNSRDNAENTETESTIISAFSETQTATINQWATSNRVSLAAIVTAATGIVLSKHGNSTDFVIGVPTASRNHPQLQQLIGNLVNTLPLRLSIDYNRNGVDYVKSVQDRYVAVLEHQMYPFQYLLEDINYQRNGEDHPLFNMMVSVNNGNQTTSEDRKINLKKDTSLYDLTFTFLNENDKLILALEYNTSKFSGDTVKCLINELHTVLEQLIADESVLLNKISLISATEEVKEIAPQTIIGDQPTVLELFRQKAVSNPDYCAVQEGDTVISYEELFHLACAFANRIQNEHEPSQGSCIAIELNKSIDQIASMFAVWMLGCVYVPIDGELPAERKKYILQNCSAKLTITEDFCRSVNDKNIPSELTAYTQLDLESPAHFLYTSGTTGTPKGVIITHANLASKILDETELLKFNEKSVTYALTSTGFDVSFLETVLSLANGGKIIIPSRNALESPVLTWEEIDQTGVTHLQGTPTYFSHLVTGLTADRPYQLEQLQTICIGGESLQQQLVIQLKERLPHVRLNNHYGPTEITIDALVNENLTDFPQNIIGTPFGATNCFVVDDFGNILPAGIAGELVIGGPGVFKGYWGDKELTAAKLKPINGSNQLYYHSGDRVIRHATGEFEFIGRKDQQIKLRGYRIEPDDINAVILRETSAIAAYTAVIEDNLVTWVAGNNCQIDAITEVCSLHLPAYMVPTKVVLLDEMPMNQNGKIAVNLLPRLDFVDSEVLAPVTDDEQLMLQLWSEVLECPINNMKANFYGLGGHSLKLMQLKSLYSDHWGVTLNLKNLFQALTPEAHLLLILQKKGTSLSGIEQAPEALDYPVTPVQQTIWISSQTEEGSIAYNIPQWIEYPTTVDSDQLEKAISELVLRHEILRTTFALNEATDIRQIVHADLNRFVQLITDSCDEKGAHERIQQDIRTAFDLENGPLFRIRLFQLTDGRSIIYYCLHHSIGDAASLRLFERDLLLFYTEEKGTEPLPKLHYKDYAVWQQHQLNSQKAVEHQEYWKNRLSGDLPRLELPTTIIRPGFKTYTGNALSIELSPELIQSLTDFSTKNNSSLFTTLLTAWKVLFYRYTAQRDILIGTPVSMRDRHDLVDQIGNYLQTVPLLNRVNPESSFIEMCSSVQSNFLNDLEHTDYPFDRIVADLEQTPDTSHTPLFDIFFTLQHLEHGGRPTGTNEVIQHGSVPVKFDLDINMQSFGETMRCYISYNKDIYDAALVSGLLRNFNVLLTNLLANSTEQLHTVDYFKYEERPESPDSSASYTITSVIQQFHQQVTRTPHQLAVYDNDQKLSFSELDALANRFAGYLLKEHDISVNDRVAIQLPHTVNVVAVMLGIKKLGAVYVPVDLETPHERVQFIASDSQCKLIIDSEKLEQLLASADDFVPVATDITPETLEFIVYTSGSTGNPKGVMITAKNIQNRLQWMWETYSFTETDRCCAKTSVSFVDHIWEIFGPLLSGVSLCFFTKEDVLNIPSFISKLSEQSITRLILVPSLLKAMLQFPEHCAGQLGSLKLWVSSGEALEEALVEQFYATMRRADVHLLNIYGSTELTADATYYDTAETYNSYRKFALFAESHQDQIDEIISSHDLFMRTHNNGLNRGLGLEFSDVSADSPSDRQTYLQFLKDVVAKDVINVSHPAFIGHMTGPAPTFFREMNQLMTVLNQNLVKIETSGVASAIERQVIGIFHHLVFRNSSDFYTEHVQHPNSSLGIVTNGGTLSNISAFSYALNKHLKAEGAFKGITEEGLVAALDHYDYKKAVIIGSKWCHYSIGKALKLTGLGKQSFVELDYEGKSEQEIERELTGLIQQLREERVLIVGMVAVAGTTEGGMVEPLTILGNVAGKHGIHFHVDAAFGGSFLTDDILRHKLDGIECADTVTICAHKQFYLPIGLSLCLFNDPSFVEASENNTHYQARKNSFDLGKFTIEGSRNFMSLLLHAAFQMFGKEGFASVVRNNYNNAQVFADLVRDDSAFELMYQPDLNIVLYRYIPVAYRGRISFTEEETEAINTINQTIQQQQFDAGYTFVSYTKVKNTATQLYNSWFRTVFMNPYSTTRDFIQVLEDQKKIAAVIEGVAYVPASVSLKKHVPIGKSLNNVQAYILDEFQHPVAPGVYGEICFSGSCVTNGYLNPENQTVDRYIDNPFGEGKLFRTGDIGTWLEDGNISYLGRRDHQIKIHGYRIELDEISIKTRMIPGVKDTVIHTQEIDGNTEIIAYLIGEEINEGVLNDTWSKMLPNYMIPTRVIILEAFPLTPGGKIDRKQLPRVTGSTTTVIKAPETETEIRIHQIWKEVIGEKEFGVTTDFFQLGGHSLNIAQLLARYTTAFGKNIRITELFQERTIEQHARLLEGASGKTFDTIPLTKEQDSYPLSPNQNGLWALSMAQDARTAYNMCYAVSLKGETDIASLKKAFLELTNRHEILRTSFITDSTQGEVRQLVHPTVIPTDFLYETSESDTAKALNDLNHYAHQFESPCLWKVGIWQIEEGNCLVGLNIHHIIADGWSIEVLLRDVFRIYADLIAQRSISLPPLRIHYKDVAVHLTQQLSNSGYNRHKAYWLDRFSADIPLLELPTQFSRPAIKTYNGADVSGILNPTITKRLNELCAEGNATLFMGLMALVQGFLYKYTGQNRMVIGAPVSGRDHQELEDQIGYYVRTLAFLNDFQSDWNVRQLLEATRTTVLEGLDHIDFALDELIRELQLTPDLSRSPLFDVLLVIKNKNEEQQTILSSIDGLEILPVDVENTFAKYDITFVFNELEDSILFSLEYNTDLFTPMFMNDMCDRLVTFAESFLSKDKPVLKTASLLDDSTVQKLIGEFNNTTHSIDLNDSIGQQLIRSYERNQASNGLLFEDKAYSYSEIRNRVDLIAACLQSEGISEGSHVAVFINRSEWSAFTMLAIYALGAVYIPIDASLPDERIHFILNDSVSSLVIVDDLTASRIENVRVQSLELQSILSSQPTEVHYPAYIAPESTSYIIYTSGSTGNPKGVAQTYLMLQNLMAWNIQQSGLKHQQRFLSFSSFGFDSSLNDILFCLLTNGTVYLVNEDDRHNFNRLKTWILDEKIETVSMPYSALKAFFEEFSSADLEGHAIEVVISTGEQLFISGGLREFLVNHPEITLHNFYGPSETHVVTASHFNSTAELPVKAMIGKPLYNTTLRVVDQDMNLVPIGVNGQLYIGGWNLANGYYGNPEMSQAKFISDPFAVDELMYASGDLVRWLPNGELEYIQRIDGQIKIRGFRVEIGEIEAKLNDLIGINSGVVHYLKINEQLSGLAAYYLTSNDKTPQEVKTELQQVLPDYMVPTWIFKLDQFPITVNGKVDKRALPKPESGTSQFATEYAAPENDIELFLTELWQELFGSDRIGIDDNFFEIGGHSLLAVRIINRIQTNYAIKLDLKDLYLQPTVRTIARQISMDKWLSNTDSVAENTEDVENFTF